MLPHAFVDLPMLRDSHTEHWADGEYSKHRPHAKIDAGKWSYKAVRKHSQETSNSQQLYPNILASHTVAKTQEECRQGLAVCLLDRQVHTEGL